MRLGGFGERNVEAGVDEAGHVFGPLDIALHPVEAVRGASEKHGNSVDWLVMVNGRVT